MTLKFDRWPWKAIGPSPKQHQVICIISSSYGNLNWSYSPETVKLGCDICDLDLWPWPFVWTSLLSLVITPENFMMIRWWEHSEKGVTDRQTDRRTENTIHRAAWSQLKMSQITTYLCYYLDLWPKTMKSSECYYFQYVCQTWKQFIQCLWSYHTHIIYTAGSTKMIQIKMRKNLSVSKFHKMVLMLNTPWRSASILNCMDLIFQVGSWLKILKMKKKNRHFSDALDP